MGMVADAETGRFDAVLVKRRDRYARSLGDAAIYERLLASYGVRVWSHDEPATNDDSPAGFLMRDARRVRGALLGWDAAQDERRLAQEG